MGSEPVVTDRPATMVIERELVIAERWLGLVESVTVIVGVLEPTAAGVPEMAPEELIVRPLGSPVADHV